MRPELVDEGVEVDSRATLDIQVDTTVRSDLHILLLQCPHSPIENSIAERTRRAASTEEDVPDGVGELLCLRRRREASGASRTTQADSDDLALGLTELDV